MKTRIALNGNDGSWRIGIGERSRFESYIAFDWSGFDRFIEDHCDQTVFLSLSYELRKVIYPGQEPVSERFPLIAAWVPESFYFIEDDQVVLAEGSNNPENHRLAEACLKPDEQTVEVEWKPRQSKADYLEQIRVLQEQIRLGNLYEINYCQEMVAENVQCETFTGVYHALNDISRAPFSLLYESDDWMIASASPERFLRKTGNRLISQPIKGTARRHNDPVTDEAIRNELQTNLKDRTENVMIVDLVRNDLSRVAAKGSVQVDELFGVYTFPTVHQLISTVSCELKENMPFSEIIKALFPMGSMTGAPKVAAMEWAEKTERFTRGIYSGSMGYIAPNGDFDLNVMIRSLVLDRKQNRLNCGVGGAITILSDPEAEYEECRIKVGRILETIGKCQW